MDDRVRTVNLHEIAHGRSGDKGDRLNVSVIAYRDEFWPILLEQVTADRVDGLFNPDGSGGTVRYELPNLKALNFVIDNALGGGVNSSLALDRHGKTLSYAVLALPVAVSTSLLGGLANHLTNP